MSTKFIRVIISGLPKSGKTTVANLIADVLADRGLDILIEADEESNGNRADALQAIVSSGTEIRIIEKDASPRGVASVNGHGGTIERRARNDSKRTRFDKPNRPKEEWFSGVDEDIGCTDCGSTFVFTVGEQEFFKQNDLDRIPRRCRSCRSARKNGRQPSKQEQETWP